MEKSENNIKLSVCITTYNQVKFIGQCLQSIIDQVTEFQLEIIVGDDASTDGTAAIVKEFSTRFPNTIIPLLHKANIGAQQNYLTTHALAKGTYIAHMDGDDYALPGKLQAQAIFLDSNPNFNIVWHRMKFLDQKRGLMKDDKVDVQSLPPDGFRRSDLFCMGSIACHSSMMYRRSCQAIIEYQGQMLDFFMAVCYLGEKRAALLPGVYGVYRVGIGISTSLRNTRNVMISNLKYLLRKFPKERRYIGGYALLMFARDLLGFRETVYITALFWLRSFHPASIIEIIRRYRLLKGFRSPL